MVLSERETENNMVNNELSVMAMVEIGSATERVMHLAKVELDAFFDGTKETPHGNYGITALSKDVAAKSGESLDFCTTICTAYTRKIGLVAKKGRNGGFPRTKESTPPAAIEACGTVVEPEPVEEPAPMTEPLSAAAE